MAGFRPEDCSDSVPHSLKFYKGGVPHDEGSIRKEGGLRACLLGRISPWLQKGSTPPFVDT